MPVRQACHVLLEQNYREMEKALGLVIAARFTRSEYAINPMSDVQLSVERRLI